MKISVILVEKSIDYFDDYTCPTSIITFLYKIHSNALLLGEVVMEICTQIFFYYQSFITM